MPHAQPAGHLAMPTRGVGEGVLVLHAWWGLNDTMREVCTRLAESGFIAFAPDLYRGKTADTIPDAERLSSALDANQARADIVNAVEFLAERAGASARGGLAVIGFSLGAYFALESSATHPEHIRSVVVFYGTGPSDFGRSKAAYLGHFAETDKFEPQASVDKLEADLRRAQLPVQFHTKPGTGHWFFEADRSQAFNAAAASLAWERTLAFLRKRAD